MSRLRKMLTRAAAILLIAFGLLTAGIVLVALGQAVNGYVEADGKDFIALPLLIVLSFLLLKSGRDLLRKRLTDE